MISIIRLRRGILATALCVALAACDNSWLEDAPSLDTMLSKVWLFGDTESADDQADSPPAVYCYHTIGVGDCHDEPLDGGGSRLVGFEGPPPSPVPRASAP